MNYQPVPSPGYQLDVIGGVSGAYRTVTDNVGVLVELAWQPLAIVWVIALVFFLIGHGWFLALLASLVNGIGFLIFATTFLVRCHRFALLGERDTRTLFPSGWGDFLLAAVKVGGIAAIAVFATILIAVTAWSVAPFLGLLLMLAGYGAVALAATRIALVFPAAAIARPMSLRDAWGRLAGNFWRLLGGIILCVLPFAVVDVFVIRIGAGSFWLTWLVLEAIRLAVAFAGMAVAATLLSEAYAGIVEGRAASIAAE